MMRGNLVPGWDRENKMWWAYSNVLINKIQCLIYFSSWLGQG